MTTITKKTMLLPVPVPVFTGAKSAGCADGTVKPNSTVTITGTDLDRIKSDDILTFQVPKEEGTMPAFATDVTVAPDGKSLTCQFGDAPEGMIAGSGEITLEPSAGGAYITTLDVNYVMA